MDGVTGFAVGASSVLVSLWLRRRYAATAARAEEGATPALAAPPSCGKRLDVAEGELPSHGYEMAVWPPARCEDSFVSAMTDSEVQMRIDQEVARQRSLADADAQRKIDQEVALQRSLVEADAQRRIDQEVARQRAQIEGEIRAQRQATLDLQGASQQRSHTLASALATAEEAKQKAREELEQERSDNRSLESKVKLLQEQLGSERKQAAESKRRKRDAEAEATIAQQEARTKELEERYGRLFDEIDRTRDGVLSHNDFKAYVSTKDMAARLKLGIGRWQEFLAAADENGDGVISKVEFVRFFSRTNLDPVRCFGALFDAIDTDGNGRLTRHEITSYRAYKNPWLFELLNVRDWSELIRELDMEADGCISRDAWVSHFTRKQVGGTVAWEPTAPLSAKRRRRSCVW